METEAGNEGGQAQVPSDWEVQRKGLIGETQKERQARQLAESKASELEAKLAEMSAWRAENEPKLGKLTEYEKREAERAEALIASNAQRLAALPEELRELAPEGLSPQAMAAHLDRLAKRAQAPTGTVANGGAAGGVTPEMEAVFNRLNLDPELRTVDFWKRLPENLRK